METNFWVFAERRINTAFDRFARNNINSFAKKGASMFGAVLLVFCIIFSSVGVPYAYARAERHILMQEIQTSGETYARKLEIRRILDVIESRNTDKKAAKRMEDKLIVMNDERLRLVSSLCNRIPLSDRENAGADIAFSLMTALIVLS